jgi:hypothetical protein
MFDTVLYIAGTRYHSEIVLMPRPVIKLFDEVIVSAFGSCRIHNTIHKIATVRARVASYELGHFILCLIQLFILHGQDTTVKFFFTQHI